MTSGALVVAVAAFLSGSALLPGLASTRALASDGSAALGTSGVWLRSEPFESFHPQMGAAATASPSDSRLEPGPEPTAGWLSAARSGIAAREYSPSRTRRGLQAPNRAHGLRTYFEPGGVRIVDRTASKGQALLALSLAGMGRGEELQSIGPGEVSYRGARVEIARGALGVVEWFLNSADGLEQGVDVADPPLGSGALELEVRVGGARVALLDGGLMFASEAGRRLRYDALHVEDARGSSLPAHFELAENGFRIVVSDEGAQYPITIDPLLTSSFDNEIESNQLGAFLGRAVAAAGDVNGDGYADVIVGAYAYDSGETDEGAAFLFHGGPGGIGDGNPINADTLIQSNQVSARMGFRVSAAGDVNGDGYDDILVGADLYESTALQAEEGAAFVYLGGPAGIADGDPTTSDAAFEGNQAGANFGLGIAAAGDVNGDGYDDILIGAPNYDAPEVDEGAAFVYLGGAAGLSDGDPTTAHAVFESDQAGAQLGFNLASAGDLDADGFDDIILGAALYDDNGLVEQGLAIVFHGSAAGLSDGDPSTAGSRVRGDQAFARLGSSVAGAGDVNGDGYGDVIVGAYLWEDGTTAVNAGVAAVYHGGPFGIGIFLNPALADGLLKGPQAGSQLGWSVASAGDVNGDGYADVVAGAHGLDAPLNNEGGAYVVLGSATGVGNGFISFLGYATLESNQADASFGVQVASAGDVNGDGFDDVLVGAHAFDGPQIDEGQAFLFHGGATGIADGDPGTAHAQLESDQASAVLGDSVASAGDVNGDGFADIIVGAPGFDAGESGEGAAFVFLGRAVGIAGGDPGTAHAQLESDQVDAVLGNSVASAGDVNGDGFGDVIVGARSFDAGESNEGAAFVFLGSASGIADGDPGTAHAQLESDQVDAVLGNSVASAGDVNGDGFADVIVGAPYFDAGESDEGAAFVFLGSALGIADGDPGTAHAQLESDQVFALLGDSAASAGDVNGDGFADVIVGALDFDAGESDEGAAFVFLGSAVGVADGDPGTAHAQLESDQGSAFLGDSVASAGDVNGDGFADLIVGAEFFDAGEVNEGAAFVFLGSAMGIADGDPGTAHAQLESGQGTAFLGDSVASAGDVNGDGFADVIVGAPDFDAGESEEGAVFVFLGSAVGIADGDPGTAHAQLESDQASALLGDSVASAGDVNGDGFADVIVGAPFFDAGESDEGAAFVFLGSEGSRISGVQQYRGDGSGTLVLPEGLSFSADSFTLELDVVSPRGRERAMLEVEACPPGVAFGDPSCTQHFSPSWVDLGTTGASFSETIGGLAPSTLYHWRARALYAPLHVTEPGITPPPNPRPGRWHRPGSLAGAADIRTVPEPGAILGLGSGVLLLCALRARREATPTGRGVRR